jgi:hypothetical protein
VSKNSAARAARLQSISCASFFARAGNFSDNRRFTQIIGNYIAQAINLILNFVGGFMNYLKKLGLVCVAIAFLMSIAVVSSYGQRYRERSWQNRDSYWQNYQYRRYRRSRITPQEYRRLARQRERLNRRTYRYYRNDGYLSYRERRRLYRQYNRYQRNVRRDRRDW